jgi:hypothetical protein
MSVISQTEEAFQAWAKDIAQKTGFQLGERLYRGTYYRADVVRDMIFEGVWQGRPAVLKLYDDPRLSNEGAALQAFHENNKSAWLTAPALYAFEAVSAKRGWLVMERLPEPGSFFQSPLSLAEKKVFFDVYREYRRHFSLEATRPLTLVEQLPAGEFHRTRIAQWFRLANDREAERVAAGEEKVLFASEILPLYTQAMEVIRTEFDRRRMVWCHGHVKPKEIYRTLDGRWYLTDFAHTNLYPEGYELAFIIWADQLMVADWRLSYAEWRRGIDEWLEVFRADAAAASTQSFEGLMRASLLERCLGTILADLAAADRPREEQEGRLKHLTRFIRDLLDAC